MIDDSLSLDDASRIGLDDDHRSVHPSQSLLRLFEEVDEAGRIDHRDVDSVIGRVGETDGRRLQVRRIFGLVVGYGRTVGDRAAPRDRSGVREDRLDERRLAGVVRSDESDISETLNIRQSLYPCSENGC